jgi:serine/threonine protein kinase
MTPERWQKVEEVLQGALDLPAHERAAFVDEACEDDELLNREVTSLAEAHDDAADFIEEPAIAQDARVLLKYGESNIGRQLGPYRILQCLGAGGMGEVYLAKDERLARLVALKILPTYFWSHERLQRFQKEARAVSALNHPNILTIHEVGESDQVRFIATEFIEGQTLRRLITDADLSLDEVLEIAIQVCLALTAAHAAGIVHRDIKPENIMRRPDGIVKILDFGIAKLVEQAGEHSNEGFLNAQTETGEVVGTVGYMSPEQARGLPVDLRTDIWSLGVVLYEMLTQRVPFTRATRLDTMVAILERDPPPLTRFTEDAELWPIQGIVDKALCKEARARYQTAAEFLADLKSAKQQLDGIEQSRRQLITDVLRTPPEPQPSSNAGVSVRSPSAVVIEAKPERQSPRPAVALVIGIMLLVATVAAALVYKRWPTSRPDSQTVVATIKPYSQMSESEQLTFVSEQGSRISTMMGDRSVQLKPDAVKAIKSYVDRYVERTGSNSSKAGEESLSSIYARVPPYLPIITRSFRARNVPLIVGIYLPMIESEYKSCFENSVGAKGLFQFLPQVAEKYGVARNEMCDVEKSTPAAAHYIADRMAELGDDAQSLTLVLLSYNRGAEGVRDALRQLRETGYYDRNFWTLFDNRERLGNILRDENASYVPSFFAAAIIGENPQSFGLPLPPLSTLATAEGQATEAPRN